MTKFTALALFTACSGQHEHAPVKSGSASVAGSGTSSNVGDPSLKMNRTQAGTPDANGWYLAHSDRGRFTVLMPSPFNDFSVDSMSEKGAPIASNVIGTQRTDGVKFSVVCNRGGDLPPDEALRALQSKTSSPVVTHLTFNGLTAVEMRLTDPVGVVRAIALADQLCLLMVDPQGSTKIVPDTDAKTMFESFTPDPTAK